MSEAFDAADMLDGPPTSDVAQRTTHIAEGIGNAVRTSVQVPLRLPMDETLRQMDADEDVPAHAAAREVAMPPSSPLTEHSPHASSPLPLPVPYASASEERPYFLRPERFADPPIDEDSPGRVANAGAVVRVVFLPMPTRAHKSVHFAVEFLGAVPTLLPDSGREPRVSHRDQSPTCPRRTTLSGFGSRASLLGRGRGHGQVGCPTPPFGTSDTGSDRW